jgi:opacity protein-like surface antigen
MKGFGRLVMAFGVLAVGLTGTAFAQAGGQDAPMAVQFTVGPTFGNASDLSLGGEFDWKLGVEWEVFLEAGQMRNVATKNMETSAAVIVNALGGSAAIAQKATYVDAGIKYLFVPFGGGYTPYLGVGFGAAQLKKDVTFTIGGSALSESQLLSQYGVQLGNDLAGESWRPLVMVAVGVSRTFAGRAFLDVSYRYGAVFAKTKLIENDKMTNTQRLQFGVGVRF